MRDQISNTSRYLLAVENPRTSDELFDVMLDLAAHIGAERWVYIHAPPFGTDPERDPLGAGYHITQSKIAIGSGGPFGKGWLEGTQAKLDFLPEAHTDFIFAVIAEELGLIGAGLLLLLYLAIVTRGLLIAVRAQDTFQRLLAAALTLQFFVYVFINVGMVIGLLPVVGVPLPLISFGGTSAVSLLVGFGMLMSIQTNRKLLAN